MTVGTLPRAPRRNSAITFSVREANSPMESALGVELRRIQARIPVGRPQDTAARKNGIEARWEFGRALLRHRKGKRLRQGLRGAVAQEFGLATPEINRRIQFAAMFSTREEVEAAITTYRSWERIQREALPNHLRVDNANQKHIENFKELAASRITQILSSATTAEEIWALAELFDATSKQLVDKYQIRQEGS